jgi:hypothetical protein
MNIVYVGIDLAKNVFVVHGVWPRSGSATDGHSKRCSTIPALVRGGLSSDDSLYSAMTQPDVNRDCAIE